MPLPQALTSFSGLISLAKLLQRQIVVVAPPVACSMPTTVRHSTRTTAAENGTGSGPPAPPFSRGVSLASVTWPSMMWQAGIPARDGQRAYERHSHALFTARIRLRVAASDLGAARRQLRQMAAAFGQFTVESDAKFVTRKPARLRRGFLVSVQELATIWHPPLGTVKAERMNVTRTAQLEPPGRISSRSGAADRSRALSKSAGLGAIGGRCSFTSPLGAR